MTTDNWYRVTKRHPCPICGKPDWCMVSKDGEAVICPRTSEGADRYLGEAGYLHRFDPTKPQTFTPPPVSIMPKFIPNKPDIDWFALADQCYMTLGKEGREELARQLGVYCEKALESLYVGWSERHNAYTFPMANEYEEWIGIRLRNKAGRKWAVLGSRQGLFLPPNDQDRINPVFVLEGPTDLAALLSLGFDGIGRPSCLGCVRETRKVLQDKKRPVVIVADADEPGRSGAVKLADAIICYVPWVKVIEVPGGKDMREWVAKVTDANRATLKAIVANAALHVGKKA